MRLDYRGQNRAGGDGGIRTHEPVKANAFRVLWVNGCLVIFEGSFGELYIR